MTEAPEAAVEPGPTLADMVAFVNERHEAGRWATAGLALVKVKDRFLAIDPADRPGRRETWREFVESNFPMGFDQADELLGRLDPARRHGALRCCRCSWLLQAPCLCGAPYAPVDPEPVAPLSALERAAAAIAAEPDKSDRAIAKELGVGKDTVRRARASGAPTGASARLGLDGRRRRAPGAKKRAASTI